MKLNQIYLGNALDVLQTFEANSVDCCVSSPPYWGLRDYGTAIWIGGNETCDHLSCADIEKKANGSSTLEGYTGSQMATAEARFRYKDICEKCGAVRIDEQLGLEPRPELYVEKIVTIFSQVRRILKPTGTLWLNLGDSYWGGKGMSGSRDAEIKEERNLAGESMNAKHQQMGGKGKMRPQDGRHEIIKPKDLVGIPWMCAFALRANGWYLRSDVIWHKPNPMPESVTDRPTKSHEYIFLLTKSQSYYYDAEAIREPLSDAMIERAKYKWNGNVVDNRELRSSPEPTEQMGERWAPASGRNKRSVWTVSTKPFAEAHFATFPPDLIVDCIKAGSSEHGCCKECGSPWKRIIEKEYKKHENWFGDKQDVRNSRGGAGNSYNELIETKTTGWQPTCECNASVIPSVVLDPFSGAGTTAMVSKKFNRDYIGIELNPEYIKISDRRFAKEFGLFNELANA